MAEGGATIVLVAHRLSTVVNADQIIVVNGGQVVECGNHDSLLATEGHYFKLVQRQMQKKDSLINADDDEGDLGEVGNNQSGVFNKGKRNRRLQ
jgi:ABC-type multidrug transport system ATPase subunit